MLGRDFEWLGSSVASAGGVPTDEESLFNDVPKEAGASDAESTLLELADALQTKKRSVIKDCLKI